MTQANLTWKAITPLSQADRDSDVAAMRAVYDTWRASKERIQKESPTTLRQFTERLIRRLSIETGILERLYNLDRGTTEALVANGFVEELISRASTDIEPSRLIDILRDQEAAIQLVIDCVAGKRALTKNVMNQLHEILTRHQDTTTAVDALGRRVEISLLKGQFKQHPNNPNRPDGSIHEYCPPIHVESEMDNLLAWLPNYANEDPVIVSAWFHHRFAQIHPYQDGNGRVARALTTLILLRADLLPLVIDRDCRVEYIHALECADRGDLSLLSMLFARLERTAILQALSVDADADISHQRNLTSAVLDSLKEKFGKRREAKRAELRKVNEVASELRSRGRHLVEQTYSALGDTIELESDRPAISIIDGGPERGNAHWYKFEVATSANEAGKYANFQEAHYFIKASIRALRERLVFVVSFHHIGRELSGIMEATAFAMLESYEQSDERASVAEKFFVCSPEPFVFTYESTVPKIGDAFARWLDTAAAVAIKEYGDRL